MTSTRVSTLVAIGLAAAVLVVGVVVVLRPDVPAVPWTVPLAVAVVALGVLAAALSFRRRLRGAPGARPYDPLHAARMVVLAKASSHAGALLAGGYGGLALGLLQRSSSALRRQDALLSGASVLAALGLVAVGLLLERFCRVPPVHGAPPAELP